jgi:hypothetical protein
VWRVLVYRSRSGTCHFDRGAGPDGHGRPSVLVVGIWGWLLHLGLGVWRNGAYRDLFRVTYILTRCRTTARAIGAALSCWAFGAGFWHLGFRCGGTGSLLRSLFRYKILTRCRGRDAARMGRLAFCRCTLAHTRPALFTVIFVLATILTRCRTTARADGDRAG